MDQRRNTPQYNALEAIITSIVLVMIYLAAGVLLRQMDQGHVNAFMVHGVSGLAIAFLGVPLAGAPLMRWLQKRGHDSILQTLLLGAAAGALMVGAMMFSLALLLIEGSVTLAGVARGLGTSLLFGAAYGALPGSIAAAAFFFVAQVLARWSSNSS